MSNLEKIKQIITFENERYFSLTEEDIINLSLEKIVGIHFDGIVISGPQFVNIQQANSLPIICAIGSNMARSSIVKSDKNILAILCGRDGKIYINPPRRQYKAVISQEKTIGEADLPPNFYEDRISGCKKYDLHKSLDIPWKPSTYRVTFIYYDWPSNTIETKLTDGEEKIIRLASLPVPSRIDAWVPAVPRSGDDGRAHIEFSLPKKIPVSAKKVVLNGTIEMAIDPLCQAKTSNNIITVWKLLHLLLIQKDQGYQPVLQVGLTIGGKVQISESIGSLALAGTFEIDLAKINSDYFSDKAEYCCYLVCYEKIAGPVMIKIDSNQ